LYSQNVLSRSLVAVIGQILLQGGRIAPQVYLISNNLFVSVNGSAFN
jgi:hypothetical protein